MTALHSLPSLQIEFDHESLSPVEGAALMDVRIQERLSCPALCELTFLAKAEIEQRCRLGSDLRVRVNERETLFVGRVSALDYLYGPDGTCQLRVRGYDPLQQLRQSFSVRTCVEVTAADLARELVADYGWAVEAPDPGPLWPRLIQHQQSDLDFLIEVAEQSGLYVNWRGDRLWLLPIAGAAALPSARAIVPLTLGDSLLEAQISLTPTAAGESVAVLGWSPTRAEPMSARASSARTGWRIPLRAPATLGIGDRLLTHQVVADERQAETIAQVQLDRQAAQSVTLWGVAEGQSQLHPGVLVALRGVADSLVGEYALSAVNHCVNAEQGFISEFSTVVPARHQRDVAANPTVGAAFSTALGQVIRLDDPEHLGRVQVMLLACEDAETAWLSVLVPGAGVGKGFVVLPDVGDRVLVLFCDRNLAQGIVLGGLYGAENGAGSGADTDIDWGIESGRTRRQCWRSAGGQRILYDDDRQMLRLENAGGSYVELLPDQMTIHANTDLTLEAPGHAVKIGGQSIDFVRRN